MKLFKKLRWVIIVIFMMVLLAGCQSEDVSYQYYSQEKLRNTLEQGSSIVILDIQVEEDFNAHHIEGAIATYAFPVNSDEDKTKLDGQVQTLEKSSDDIVIVCPLGRVGAERTYAYLLERGISAERLFILEEGQSGWNRNLEDLNTIEETEETDSEDT